MRAQRLSSDERKGIARRGAVRRWIRERFGDSSFRALGLPGGDIVDVGIDDLTAGTETIESLVVSLAAPRLRREGIPVPGSDLPDPERRLYRLLCETEREAAHSRYLAYLRRVSSFAHACSSVRRNRGRRAE